MHAASGVSSCLRYCHAVRRWAALLVFAACGGQPTSVAHTPAATPSVTRATVPPPAHVGSGSGSADTATASAPDIGCLTTSCAFHAGAAAYFTCLAGGAGACFHFGGPCTPADACMFDPGDRTYKHCARSIEGTCAQWATACAPASACMFDPTDGLHHHCDDAADGACRHYGALCRP
jgi:hypothetical protein